MAAFEPAAETLWPGPLTGEMREHWSNSPSSDASPSTSASTLPTDGGWSSPESDTSAQWRTEDESSSGSEGDSASATPTPPPREEG
eukprot:COSAG04_NODE_24972_length_314_cov_0.627907_1_plen_85_part_10